MKTLNLQLLTASGSGDEASLVDALSQGAKLEAKGQAGATSLVHAAARGHAGCLRILIAAGANLEACDKGEWTSLIHAAYRGNEPELRALIEAGAKANRGWTSAMMAAGEGHDSCLRILFAAGANLDAMDDKGRTAAFYATGSNFHELAAYVEACQLSNRERLQIEAVSLDSKSAVRPPFACDPLSDCS